MVVLLLWSHREVKVRQNLNKQKILLHRHLFMSILTLYDHVTPLVKGGKLITEPTKTHNFFAALFIKVSS